MLRIDMPAKHVLAKFKMPERQIDQLKTAIEYYFNNAPFTIEDTVRTYEIGQFSGADKVKNLQMRFCFDILYVVVMNRDWYNSVRDAGCNDDHIFSVLKALLPKVERKY